jgi:hypothetical protein
MPFWPVAAREARAAARAPRTYGWRAAVTAVGIAVIPISLWVSQTAPSPGRAVFIAVATMAFIYCLFGGVLRTADAIAEEKRENTLGLLFLTDLKVADVVSGKLLASTATLFFGLLAILPLLTIPVLIGGVSSRDLIRIALCLLNSLFFSISVGFLVSTFFRQGWVTISVGLAAMLGIVFFVPIVANLLPRFIQMTLLSFSPGTMLEIIIYNSPSEYFWQALLATHLLAWLNILLTAHYLPRFWQERPRSKRAQVRWEFLQWLRFGGDATRKRFRTRLLKHNPLFWLSGREQVSSAGLMVFLLVLCGLSLVGNWSTVLYALIAIHGTLLVRMASAASHALAEDRKSGALELLLATSLSVREVLKGRWMALGRQFFGPIIIAIIWHLFTILWMGVMSPYSKLSLILFVALFTFALSWIATGWYGMWMGIRARHPVAAIWGTLAVVLVAPLVGLGGLFSVLAIFQIIPEYGYLGEHNFELIGCAAWSFYLIALSFWTAHRVKRVFREAATDRFSDTQPIDWRPFWRMTWKVASATALIVACVWGIRAYINFSGARALEKILAAHPTFSLKAPRAAYIPEDQNLAFWDFLRPLNGRQPPFSGGRAADVNTLREVVAFSGYPIGRDLTSWRVGERYSFGQSAGKYWKTNFDAEFLRLHAAASERPFLHFVQPAGAFAGVWGPADVNYNCIAGVPRVLAARAEKRLAQGEHPVDDILLGLRFANSLTNNPETVSVFQRMLFTLIQPIYDGILDGRWSDADLLEIQNAFRRLDPPQHFELWRQKIVREVADLYDNDPPPNPWGANQAVIGGRPFYIEMRREARLPGKIKARQAEIILRGLGVVDEPVRKYRHWTHEDDGRHFQEHLIGIMSLCLNQMEPTLAQTQTAIDEVVVACAIERFRISEGKLPDALDQLVPKYLKSVPDDFMVIPELKNPPKLKYHRTENGYVLYSVGSNFRDDKGVPERTETIKGRQQHIEGDWVWIYKK